MFRFYVETFKDTLLLIPIVVIGTLVGCGLGLAIAWLFEIS